jgi:hypothetical protein
MEMARKSASPWMRLGVAVAPWALAAWLAESTLGPDIGRAGRKLEQRIEMQLKREAVPTPAPAQPERSHEDAIEPWELVGV